MIGDLEPHQHICIKRLGADDSPKRVVNSNDVIKRRFPDDAIRTGYASGPSSVLISCIEEERLMKYI